MGAQQFRENYFYNGPPKEKWKIANSKLRKKSPNQELAKM